MSEYPTKRWVVSQLRHNMISHSDRHVIDAYIVGSEAKGSASATSDLDIAVIVAPVRGKTALQLSERYHSKFSSEGQMPHWNNRVVDLQFFYATDPELATYAKIALH